MRVLPLLVLLAACSDYDLKRTTDDPDARDDTSGGVPIDTAGLGDSATDPATGWTKDDEESNFGTNFIAVTTANALLDRSFRDDFAIVVTNPDETEDANVTVTIGGTTVATTVVPPDEAVTIALPMVLDLQMALDTNVQVTDGAYEIESDIPIAAYQFNPLHYRSDAGAFSYTNDASVLIPEHVLGEEYMVASWPTLEATYPGFAAIVGVEDGTEVTIRSSTRTASGVISALGPGDEATITLDRGDVFQLFGATTPGADLTGSVIRSSAPVAVFGGHQCTYVPLESPSCDHLEEMMLPTDTWGDEFVMTGLNHPDRARPTETVYRVLALNDGTSVDFDPAVTGSTSLDRGEYLEFTTNEDFVVSSSDPVSVSQYMQSCTEIGTANGSLDGDPSMGSGIPQSQARDSYVFLVPDTYETNWVNIVAESGAGVRLDGADVSMPDSVGGSGYEVGRVEVTAGSHVVESTDGSPLTVTVYGYADFTSYLYPGGTNVIAE